MLKISRKPSLLPIVLLCLSCFLFSCEEEPNLKKNCVTTATDAEPGWITDLISDLQNEEGKEWITFGSFSIEGTEYFVVANCNPVYNTIPSFLSCEDEMLGYDFIKAELEKEGEIDISQVFGRVSYLWCGDSCDC